MYIHRSVEGSLSVITGLLLLKEIKKYDTMMVLKLLIKLQMIYNRVYEEYVEKLFLQIYESTIWLSE